MVNCLICGTFVLSFCMLVMSAPQFQSQQPQQAAAPHVLRNFYNDGYQGYQGYQFTYELDNGQIFSEAGGLKNVSPDQPPVIAKYGQYSFVGPDGQTYWVNYVADENGYRAQVGTGPGGIGAGGDAQVDQGALKSLVG